MLNEVLRQQVAFLRSLGIYEPHIAVLTGLSRQDVHRYVRSIRRRTTDTPQRVPTCFRCNGSQLDEPAYALLLGYYLGDGYIVAHPHKPRLGNMGIAQDTRYPGIVQEITEVLAKVSGTKVHHRKKPGCVMVSTWWTHVWCAFPQHGPGMKHTRPIVLEPWQRVIVRRHPEQFVRGLIFSDGCRAMNRIRHRRNGVDVWYEYPRYFFSNTSRDILGLCGWALDLLGIAWRYNRPNSISVAQRAAVARMDEFVGPKF